MERTSEWSSALVRLDPLTRRRLLISGGALAAAAGMIDHLPARAQDATPTDATPVSGESSLPAVPPEFEEETNWPYEGGNLKATRVAAGSSISSDNVSQLDLAWSFPVSVGAPYGSLVANPIVAGDAVYLQDALSNVYAVNKSTGEQLWANSYNDDVPSGGPNGLAVAYGNVYFALGGSGVVVAVAADTGEELWRTTILGYLNEGITMAPLVYGGVVYVSTIPGSPDGFYHPGQRGIIFAIDALTGKVIWYFDTVTDNLWGNARVNSGGGIWHPPSVDDNGKLYVGIANAAPFPGAPGFPSGSSRPGPNDYCNALMRLNPEIGNYDWYTNLVPHDLWDHDNHLTPILATVTIDGKDRPLVFSSGKHGFVVAADPDTGYEYWRTPVGKHDQNEFLADFPEDNSAVESYPGFIGGVETPIAYSDGVVVAAALDVLVTANADRTIGEQDITGSTSQLVGVDATTGGILWNVQFDTMAYGGATIANDVVFTGGLDGVVRGFKVADGSPVFTYQGPAGINTSFAISGDYLFVAAGAPLIAPQGSATPTASPQPALLALKLPS
jgi:outer membrane protein assembly factor BamB